MSQWSGTITTRLGPDKSPVTTFEGTWVKISGTGRYAGTRGSGTYRGRMVSEHEQSIEWKGSITAPRASASK